MQLEPLTKSQYRVVKLAALGLTNNEIKLKLGVSISTVEAQLYVAFSKLGINKRSQLPHLMATQAITWRNKRGPYEDIYMWLATSGRRFSYHEVMRIVGCCKSVAYKFVKKMGWTRKWVKKSVTPSQI